MEIPLNDLLHLNAGALHVTKIRFNRETPEGWKPLEEYRRDPDYFNTQWVLNKKNQERFRVGELVLGFAHIEGDDWLLTAAKVIASVIEDAYDAPGYETVDYAQFLPFCGRTVVRYHLESRQGVRYAAGVIGDIVVARVLDDAVAGMESGDS